MANDPRPDSVVEPTPLEHTPTAPSTAATLIAELAGTFLLVFGIVGTALFAANFGVSDEGTSLGVGFLGVSLAAGLTVIAGAYAFGPISGGHFNPAVTLGLAAAGRFPWRQVGGYLVAQLIGGLLATLVIFLTGLGGPDGWLSAAQDGGFASNGFDELSPGGFGLGAVILIEIITTAIFVTVILGVTHSTRGTKLAGLAIGLMLALMHLVAIPVSNASLNPARSIATAVFGGGDALIQVWVFIVFPIIGGLIAGFAYRFLFDDTKPFVRS
ncbi:aquaporin [Pseudoclavibacter endophyticus]|uniref:Aquaporin Z n=1 Tax=Pseudoclavibacter endophyticus TaxID=1778590 RepID=A0A6H9WRC7_9MICO|nr:aquaporin [Pseudoclavibacter endophyticus]KAB1649507.1 aquaporin Z [Pseudoclavibacter endophyticus]GGA62068.1 aquaporin [Pseudoclavibacter endophyticus]